MDVTILSRLKKLDMLVESEQTSNAEDLAEKWVLQKHNSFAGSGS